MEKTRVAVIELVLDANTVTANLVLYETSRPGELIRYLAPRPPAAPRARFIRRIFIVEWFQGGHSPRPSVPGSIRHILETQIYVPADLFHEHACHGVGSSFEPHEEQIINSYLNTALSPEQRWSLGLFDLWEYTGDTENLMRLCPISQRLLLPGDAGLTLVCEDTERQLQFHEWRARAGWLVIAPRKCSYWAREHDGVWDVVILCDPSPNAAKVVGLAERGPISLNPRNPFLGGYHEFLTRDVAANGALSRATNRVLGAEDEDEDGPDAAGAPEIMEEAEAEAVEDAAAPVPIGDMDLEAADIIEMDAVEAIPEAEAGPAEDPEIRGNILATLTNSVSPRTSLFDDLRYYFTRHASVLNPPPNYPELIPSTTTIFPLKLIASHYSLLHAFVSFQTASMRSTGWALRRETPQQIQAANQVETAWSRFRCSEYLEALETLLDSLSIPLYATATDNHPSGPGETTPLLPVHSTTPTSPSASWRSAITPDFLFLHRQFTMRRHDYDRITTSIAALAGIITGRVAVEEARSAMSLTYVAMLFAPLAWVAAVYSLPEEFAPGGAFFWQYWATAVPFMVVVWVGMQGWHLRRVLRRRVEGVRLGRKWGWWNGRDGRGRGVEDMV